MRRTAALVLAFATSLAMTMPAVARADEVAPILTGADAIDSATFARPQVARVTHVALDLALDFDAKRVSGTATLDIQAAPGAHEIVLDSNGYEVESIADPQGHALAFAFGDAMRALKNVMLMQERIDDVRQDTVRMADDLRALTGHVFEVDKRVLRIETMIEMSRPSSGGGQPRIEG